MPAVPVAALALLIALTGGAFGPSGGEGSTGEAPVAGPVVELDADEPEGPFPLPEQVIDQLEPATVLRVRADGFDEFEQGTLQQCTLGAVRTCGNRQPVQFDGDGRADVQYLVLDRTSTSGNVDCRSDAVRCVLELVGEERAVERQLFFGRTAPPVGRLSVAPSQDLADGERVQVSVSGLTPGIEVIATLCVAPDVEGSRRCGAPAPEVPIVLDARGRGTGELVVRSGPVGRARAHCGPGSDCAMAVVGRDPAVRVAVVPITFETRSATYDPPRVIAGLAIGAALVGAAAWLIRRTDWTQSAGLDSSEIDDASYADLDAIVAALDEAEALDDDADALSSSRPG